ncbi:MAG: toprim domain-containing protein [Kiritimatiellia bacterium]|nr:type IIA DNA topoisomerase subunit B [Lentisphaerota bacterium]
MSRIKAPSKAHIYDESKVKTLSSLEHIRLRTGMYIGRTGDGSQYEDGIYILVKEVVDNAVDEFIMGHGKKVDINVEGERVTVRDYGRGIPLGKVVECVSKINTGAKYNDDVFQFSVGLNGVGTKAVNALSSYFVVRSHREGRFVEARFERGRKTAETSGRDGAAEDGTYIEFVPDPEIFKVFAFREELLQRRMRFYAYLNAGLILNFNGQPIAARDGLLDLIRHESQFEKVYDPLYFRDKSLELAFTHTNRFDEMFYSFVNGQFTTDGGTHLSAFREGLLKGINEYSRQRFTSDDIREGMVAAIAVRIKEPIFESQTKNKLGNTDIRAPLVAEVKEVTADLLHRNSRQAEKLIAKLEETRKLRNELQSVKKMARERSKTVAIRIPQLRDCKVHFNRKKQKGAESSIFLTEGQSAAGSLVSCRDPNIQAVFTLKGKPLNVCNLNRDALYKNTELYNLMCSLNIEETVDNLRFGRVILATDADVDGLHIRNLIITYFLRFFSRLIDEGRLYILETPLFRVRDKRQTIYCYSEREREDALRRIGRNAEITRFKGLGEISPGEFKAFIGNDMRLTPVLTKGEDAVNEIISFYMGNNTQERREYIMTNLIVDREQV